MNFCLKNFTGSNNSYSINYPLYHFILINLIFEINLFIVAVGLGYILLHLPHLHLLFIIIIIGFRTFPFLVIFELQILQVHYIPQKFYFSLFFLIPHYQLKFKFLTPFPKFFDFFRFHSISFVQFIPITITEILPSSKC